MTICHLESSVQVSPAEHQDGIRMCGQRAGPTAPESQENSKQQERSKWISQKKISSLYTGNLSSLACPDLGATRGRTLLIPISDTRAFLTKPACPSAGGCCLGAPSLGPPPLAALGGSRVSLSRVLVRTQSRVLTGCWSHGKSWTGQSERPSCWAISTPATCPLDFS